MCKDKNQGRGKKRWLKMRRKKPNQQLGGGGAHSTWTLSASAPFPTGTESPVLNRVRFQTLTNGLGHSRQIHPCWH